MAHSASSSYNLYLEKQKKLAEEKAKVEKEKLEEEKRRKEMQKNIQLKNSSIKELEDEATEIEKDRCVQTNTFKELFQNASQRLVSAINTNDKIEMNVAKSLLEAAQQKFNEAEESLLKGKAIEKRASKRKSGLISDYIIKKPKV